MAKYSIQDTTLSALGDAIREKTGKTTKPGYVDADKVNIEIPYPYSSRYHQFPTGTRSAKIKKISTNKKIWTYLCDSNKNHIVTEGNSYITWDLNNVDESIVEDVIRDGYWVEFQHSESGAFEGEFEITNYDENGEIIQIMGEVVNTMTPIKMVEAIDSLSTPPPDSAYKFSGDCQYKFSGGGWDWFIELYGDKITTNDISNCGYMFRYSKADKIPFDINIKDNITSFNFNYMFDGSKLSELPKINGKLPIPTSQYSFPTANNMLANCYYLKEIPEDYFSFLPDGYREKRESLKPNGSTSSFTSCYSLRSFPTEAYIANLNCGTGYYYSLYSNLHNYNYVLDEAVNIPVEQGPYTSSAFNSGTFNNCFRLSRVTFETNEDGTPKTANWKSQTITLGGTTTNLVGYAYSTTDKNNVIKYGGGVITADKEVKDDATYAALKNDPDWFSTSELYSRYNKLSAIETISTLPDVSASGGTNTIKFRGIAGGNTDGGAINTMTEAEIAVATAKGWTVAYI